MADERQRGYQKKYDKKTKMISVKYVKHDMDDYNRLKKYLEQTGKSANGFIKELINDFFEKEKYVLNRKRIADYFVDYNVSVELLNKLKDTVGEEKYLIIMEYYRDCIVDELDSTYNDKGDMFDEWIEQFLEDIECGEINIDVPEKEFREMIHISISDNVQEVAYYGWLLYHNLINLSSVPKMKIGIT